MFTFIIGMCVGAFAYAYYSKNKHSAGMVSFKKKLKKAVEELKSKE